MQCAECRLDYKKSPLLLVTQTAVGCLLSRAEELEKEKDILILENCKGSSVLDDCRNEIKRLEKELAEERIKTESYEALIKVMGDKLTLFNAELAELRKGLPNGL
jgi:hypothetical protein